MGDFFDAVGTFFTDTVPGFFTDTIPDFFTETLPDAFTELGNKILEALEALGDQIASAIIGALNEFFGKIMYYITRGILYVVRLLQQLFNVFSGMTKIAYRGNYAYITDVFFGNRSVSNIYWAIALIGMTFVFGFAILAVIRKMFDLGDKRPNQSLGNILGSTAKSIFIMLILSLAVSASINLTNVLVNRISYAFDNADSLDRNHYIRFDDEQRATMARIFKTIGNYSLNPSYASHYNLNSCYNDIRQDLLYLQKQGVFDMVYDTGGGSQQALTWQSALQELVNAANPMRDLKLDAYYEAPSNALLSIMDTLRTDRSFAPLEEYEENYTTFNNVGMDRILFLSGTTEAARNAAYNVSPYLTDGVRGPFYQGIKSIYSFDEVKAVFDTSFTGIKYIFIWITAYFTIKNLFRAIFSCVTRLFNMVSLYIIAPLAIAPMPLDDGEKFRQWMLAMVVQTLGILGVVIPMRLMLLFAPIIMSPELVIFESSAVDMLAKVILIIGGIVATDGFGEMITGILANNAGMAAIRSGDRGAMLGGRVFGLAQQGTVKAAGVAADITGLSTVGKRVSEGAQSVTQRMQEHFGLVGAAVSGLRGSSTDRQQTGAGGSVPGSTPLPGSERAREADHAGAQETAGAAAGGAPGETESRSAMRAMSADRAAGAPAGTRKTPPQRRP